jgi:hypothetical protein
MDGTEDRDEERNKPLDECTPTVLTSQISRPSRTLCWKGKETIT